MASFNTTETNDQNFSANMTEMSQWKKNSFEMSLRDLVFFQYSLALYL